MQLGQGGDVGRQGKLIPGDGVHIVYAEPDIGKGGGAAVGAGEASHLFVGAAVCVHQGGVAVAGIDALHPGLGKGEELACFGVTVAVGIFPDPEARVGGVTLVNAAIVVGVELRQGLKTVGCLGAISLHGIVAEQLGPGVYTAITVSVVDQEAVVGPGPAGLFGEAVACMVEMGSGLDVDGLYPVAVQVEDEGRDGLFGSGEQVADAFHNGVWRFGLFVFQVDFQGIVGEVFYGENCTVFFDRESASRPGIGFAVVAFVDLRTDFFLRAAAQFPDIGEADLAAAVGILDGVAVAGKVDIFAGAAFEKIRTVTANEAIIISAAKQRVISAIPIQLQRLAGTPAIDGVLAVVAVVDGGAKIISCDLDHVVPIAEIDFFNVFDPGVAEI